MESINKNFYNRERKYILSLIFLFPFILNAQKFPLNENFYIDRIIGLDSVNIYQYRLIKYPLKKDQKTNYLYYLSFDTDGKFDSRDSGSTCGLDIYKSISGSYQIIDDSHILLTPKLYHNSKKLYPETISSKSYLFFISKESEDYFKLIQSKGNIKDDKKNAILSKELDKKIKTYDRRSIFELCDYKPKSKDNISRVDEYIRNVWRKNPKDYDILFVAWYPDDFLVNIVYNRKTKKRTLILNYVAKYVENTMGHI